VVLNSDLPSWLKHTTHEPLDAAAGGAFFSLQVPAAKELIEKMVAIQGWDGDRLQPCTRGVHQVDGIDMIAAKMDLLMMKLEASSALLHDTCSKSRLHPSQASSP
jgi:hypothetical protein